MENSITVQETKQATLSTSIGQSRPQLAVINEDYPKVRTEGANELSELINYIVTLLNLKIDDSEAEREKMDMQMLLVGDLIRTEFGSLTIPEIKTAFKMYVSKQLPVKVFRILDCISVGEILTAFTDYRNENLRVYDEKKRAMKEQSQLPEISESQKQELVKSGVIRVFSEYKETKSLPEPNAWVFDELYERGLIKGGTTPALQAYYQKKYEQAQHEVEGELSQVKIETPAQSKEIKAEIERIQTGQSDKVILKTKSIILKEYFDKLLNNNEEIETYLK